ncbi:MAG: methyltransferase domain-containing protein [Promethearchaeota archaeon]|jgi:SAM-dependent methyltransferase
MERILEYQYIKDLIYLKFLMNKQHLNKFYSQLDLPFQETKQLYLKHIFKTLESKFNLLKNSKQTFIDLGSGNGQVIIYCALNYGIRSIGIEIDPILVEEAKNSIRSLSERNNTKKTVLSKITLISGDFYDLNLREYDFIYIYSLPTMQKYLKHMFKNVKNGAIIISHKYSLNGFNQFLDLRLKLEYEGEKHDSATYFYKKI